MPIVVALRRTHDSRLLAICLSEGLKGDNKLPRIVRDHRIPQHPLANPPTAYMAKKGAKDKGGKQTSKAQTPKGEPKLEPRAKSKESTAKAPVVKPPERLTSPVPTKSPDCATDCASDSAMSGHSATLTIEVMTMGKNYHPSLQILEEAWGANKLKEGYMEFSNRSTAKDPKAIICISNLYLKDPDQDQHSLVRDHGGFHPDVMRGIATYNKAFIAAAKAVELAIKDCTDKGFDEIVLITYRNQKRHRSVGSGFLLREILLEAGHAVVVNTVDAEESWPKMRGTCRGQCAICSHIGQLQGREVRDIAAEIADDFIAAVSVAEPSKDAVLRVDLAAPAGSASSEPPHYPLR